VRVVHGNLGALYVGAGRYPEAERELLRALEIEPNATASLINLGALYQYLGRDQEAARIFERARAIGQETPALLLNLGDSYRRLTMTAAAAAAYMRGRELAEGLLLRDPGDAIATVFAAYFALRLGDWATARRELVQALKLGGRNVAVLERAALCYEAMGDRNNAIAVLGSATPEALRDFARHPDLEGLRGDQRFVAMTGGSKR
jgi:tetratricopeptide (TPR) repeat protein